MTGQYFDEEGLDEIISQVATITQNFELGDIHFEEDETTTEKRYDLLVATSYLGEEILERDPSRRKEGASKSSLEQSISNIEDYIEDFTEYQPPKVRTFKGDELKDIRTVYLETGEYLSENRNIDFKGEDVGFLANSGETVEALRSEISDIAEELEK